MRLFALALLSTVACMPGYVCDKAASLNAAVDLQRSVVFLSGYSDQSVTIRRGSSASNATAAWTVVEFPP